MMASRKAVLDKNKQQLLDSVNASNKIYTNEELSILLEEVIKKQDNMLDKVYPVGSIYISYASTNPGSLFGGTWVAYGTGRTLVGVDSSQTEFNMIGKSGGEKTHVLALNEMPLHNHSLEDSVDEGVPVSARIALKAGAYLKQSGYGGNGYMGKAGGGQAHNNLQPYITVYMWRRTA